MREIENIASSLFDKIRTRFDNVNLGDESAKSTTDPEKARYINFDYEDANGNRLGNITLSLVDEKGLKVYFNKDIVDKLKAEGADDQDWFAFLRSLRSFAKRNLLNFDVRDISKSNLQLKDIKQQSKADSTLDTTDISMTESRMYGTSRSSYQECGPTRIIVRHMGEVDEQKRGSRSRNVENIFIETHLGERFLLPEKNLHYARAMARHVSKGGRLEDELGESITSMCREMKNMAYFVREAKRRQFEDSETSQMADAAVQHYGELKNRLRHIASDKGYDYYKETYMPETDIEEEIDIDALRERFVKKVYNDRFDDALPYVYRAYKRQTESMNHPLGGQFESWANDITEGTWALPDTDDEIKELDALMAKPLPVGPNAENATALLYDILGDDQLFDELDTLADQNPEEDARPAIVAWLAKNNPELASKYQTNYQQPMAPEQPAQPQMTTGATGMDTPNPNPATMEDANGLGFLKFLAGIK